MEKHIYVILSHTNTKIGKMIRCFSNYTYSHVSISTENSLQPLYSFARYRYDSAFVGGFVEESPLRYLYNGKNTKIRIYEIPVTEEQFQQFQSIITLYKKNQNEYIYDCFYFFRNDDCRTQYQHICLSFVVSILKNMNIFSANLHIHTIKDLADVLSQFPYTETEITQNSKPDYTWGNDRFYETVPFNKTVSTTIRQFQKLLS